MKSYGRTICLKNDPAAIEAYKRYHRQVWPELLVSQRQAGIVRMKIYLRGNRLFMYVETVDGFDPARDFAKAQATAKGQEWNALMRTLQERPPEAGPDEWWAAMEEVFDSTSAEYAQ